MTCLFYIWSGLEFSNIFVTIGFVEGEIPSQDYQTNAQEIIKYRMMVGSRRLAETIKDIFGSSTQLFLQWVRVQRTMLAIFLVILALCNALVCLKGSSRNNQMLTNKIWIQSPSWLRWDKKLLRSNSRFHCQFLWVEFILVWLLW